MERNGEVIKEIRDLLREDNLNTDAAIRLMLTMQLRILEEVERTIRRVDEAVAVQTKYPSVSWMFSHHPKKTIAIVFAVFMVLYTLLSPITISDMRHAILEWVGIPVP